MAAAATGQALLVGAGTSAEPPSGLPLGAAFDDLLLECFVAAARRVASDLVEPSGLAAVQRRRCNLLRLLAVRAGRDVVVDLLECFRVVVPTEAQLLTAALAARGVLVLTLNIDDGVERAYAVLAGDADLPPGVHPVFHTTLDAWRHRLKVVGPLRVVGAGFVAADYDRRPTSFFSPPA